MANKSVIDIAIDDSQFKAFYELYKEYEEKLGEMPEDWDKVGQAINGAGESMDEFAKLSDNSKEFLMIAAIQADAIANSISQATANQNQFGKSLKKNEGVMKSMAGHAKKIAANVLKIGAWGMGIGMAGLFGLNRLGESAISREREAKGLGVSPGELTAFKMNMGRYVNASILENVANAKNSYQGRVWLGMATGQSTEAIQSKGAADVAFDVAMKAHDWWQNTPAWMRTAENLKATGFPQVGLTLEDMRRLGGSSVQQLAQAKKSYQETKGIFDFSPTESDAWFKLNLAVSKAGNMIETVLINKLAILAPQIGAFVTEFSKDAEILISDALNPKNIKDFAEGIKNIAAYLGSPDFRNKLHDFEDAIMDVTQAILKVAGWFGFSPEKKESENKELAINPTGLTDKAEKQGFLAALDKSRNLPKGWMNAIYQAESGGGKHLYSSAGAVGPFQFTKKTAKQYGLANPMDFESSGMASAKMYAYLFNKYHDPRKALAGYNWGEGALDKDIAKYGANWEAHAPAETRGYINKVMTMTGNPKASMSNQGVDRIVKAIKTQNNQVNKMVIQDNTAGRLAISMNAAAY